MTTDQNPEGTHQDPANQYQDDTSVDTSQQADPAEAPVAAEPKPVEVSPGTADVKSDTVLGKDYEVSPDRGYRVKQEDSSSDAGDSGDDSSDES